MRILAIIRRCLKVIALVLIIFPEPVTTALGIIILSAIAALFVQKRLSKFGDLEELVRKSLKNEKLNEPQLRIFKNQNTVFHELKINMALQPAAFPVEVNEPKGNQPAFQPNSWFDNRKVPEKVLHHTIKTSFPQYEEALSRQTTGSNTA